MSSKDSAADTDISTVDLDADERATRLSQLDETWVKNSTGTDQKLLMVYTFYVSACPEFPRGTMVIIVGSEIAEEGANPSYPSENENQKTWPKTPWPLFAIPCDPRENSFWGRGRALDMIQPQQAFNGVVSKSLQHLAVIANTKIVMPNDLDTEWTDEIGQIFRVGRTTDHNSIRFLQPPDLSMANYQLWDRLKAEMEYEAGISSSTMGAAATNVESGYHADMLIKRNYGRLQPVKRKMDKKWGAVLLFAMVLIQRHMTEGRQLFIVGANNQVSLKHFRRADFEAPIDITILNDQTIPTDPVQKSAFLNQLTMTLSQVEDPNLRNMIMRFYRLHEFEPYLDQLNPHQTKAERMVQALLIGESVPIFAGDDALTFVAELERCALSEEYETRVAREEDDEEQGGQSNTKKLLESYWLYYSNKLNPPKPPVMAGEPLPGGDANAPATTPQDGGAPASAPPQPGA